MIVTKIVSSFTLAALMALPLSGVSQSYSSRHARAKAAQTRSDHRHHTGAKIVGGSAVGGAVVGGLLGGGKGALIGAGAGAGGGYLVNKHRENKDIRKREARDPR